MASENSKRKFDDLCESEARDPVQGRSKAKVFLATGFNAYQPHLKNFPLTNGRKFRAEWYKEFTWLEYSISLNKAFCFYCRAFSDNATKSDDAFTETGFSSWKKAIEKFRNHQTSNVHNTSIVKAKEFTATQSSGSVAVRLDSQRKVTIDENRKYLEALVQSLLYCAKQGIAFRGHREDDTSTNKGNFLELLALRAKDNEIVKRYFVEKEKSFKYVSPEYQNNFLSIMCQQVLDSIVNKIKEAEIFSVIIDETQDLARHEQVSVIIRYCDQQLNVHENFMGFYKTDKMDGESLSLLLQNVLVSFGLQIENIRGQCYDGAAAMRGSYSGVAKRIRDLNPLAMYVHCYAHILNLCIVDVCGDVVGIRNMFGTLSSLHAFIESSSKRHSVFENFQKNLEKSSATTLKMLSDTRWACRIQAVRAFLNNLDAIIDTLQHFADNDKFYCSDAHSLLKRILDFQFIFCCKLMYIVLELTNSLSTNLQGKKTNFSTVMSLSQAIISNLSDLRNDQKFSQLWKEVEDLALKEGCNQPTLPRARKIPSKLGGGNVLQENINPSDYFRTEIYFRVLDNLKSYIKEKFRENDLNILNSLNSSLSKHEVNEKDVQFICDFYKIPTLTLLTELNTFSKMCHNENIMENFESRLEFFITMELFSCFPNMNLIFKTFLSIPMSSASAERSFSSLRRLKSYLRSTMGQERLKNLAVLEIEQDINVNISKVIDVFDNEAEQRGRRLLLH